jgi:hypothetical protein
MPSWWPAKQCLVFCSHVSDPTQGQMLIRAATATDKTECPWHVQINLQDFSCFMWVACWSPFRHSLYQFCEMFREIMNNPVFRTLFSGKKWLKIGICNLLVTSLAVVHAFFVMMLTVVFGLLVTRLAKPLSLSATWTLTDSLSFFVPQSNLRCRINKSCCWQKKWWFLKKKQSLTSVWVRVAV